MFVDYYRFHIFVAKLEKIKYSSSLLYKSLSLGIARRKNKKLAAAVKKMFVIFPFEEKLYKDSCVDAIFVGNPLVCRVLEKKSFKASNCC